jgi:hypothetical protein
MPVRDARDRIDKRSRYPAIEIQEPQQRPQPSDQRFGRSDAPTTALGHHESVDVATVEPAQPIADRLDTSGEEQPCRPLVEHNCPLGQAPLNEQVITEIGDQPVDLRHHHPVGGAQNAQGIQVVEQRSHRRQRGFRPSLTAKTFNGLRRRAGADESLTSEPRIDLPQQVQVVAYRTSGITPLGQEGRETLHQSGQRSRRLR